MRVVIDLCFPDRCPGCGRRGPPLCASCAGTVRPAPGAPPPPLVDWWTARFAYEGVVRELLARAKYRGERSALKLLARELMPCIDRAPFGIDIVTWPPASRDRYARSGVDHGAIVAGIVARAFGVRARALVHRTDASAQTGRLAAARRVGPELRVKRAVDGLTVLVVDDIATTGGTLASVARTLRNAGAQAVCAGTIARTPRPGGRSAADAYTSAASPGRPPPGGTWTSS